MQRVYCDVLSVKNRETSGPRVHGTRPATATGYDPSLRPRNVLPIQQAVEASLRRPKWAPPPRPAFAVAIVTSSFLLAGSRFSALTAALVALRPSLSFRRPGCPVVLDEIPARDVALFWGCAPAVALRRSASSAAFQSAGRSGFCGFISAFKPCRVLCSVFFPFNVTW